MELIVYNIAGSRVEAIVRVSNGTGGVKIQRAIGEAIWYIRNISA